jgi:photosystem II stability/assembly factor-like uncharacterized protein
MNPAAKKGLVATAGVAAACVACCAVPIAATASIAAVATPVGIVAAGLAATAGTWAWLRRRGKRAQS